MPSRHRQNYNFPGHAHELTFTCYCSYQFLRADRCCEWLKDSLTVARQRWNFDLWAYVFMPEHVHLIVRPREVEHDLARIRAAIKEPTAKAAIRYLEIHAPEWLPRITRRRGTKMERHFWQSGGGYDRNITESKTLSSMIDYLHLNPVRRGLVTQATDWIWSSANKFIAQKDGPIPLDPLPPEWCV